MSEYFDEFISKQLDKGRRVTPELLAVNKELKTKDEAMERYASRDFWCKIGFHRLETTWYGGRIPLTCTKCWRHFL